MPDITITVSPQVEEIIGHEQADRFRSGAALMQGECWTCEKPADATDEPLAVVCIIPEAGAGLVQITTITHARCSPSAVIHLSNEDVDARRAARGMEPDYQAADSGSEVSAVAVTWPSGPDHARPIVLLSFHDEIVARAESGDRVDLITSFLLEHGWQMITRMGRVPDAQPDGWRIRWSLHPGRPSTAPGRFEFLGPAGNPIAEIDPLQPGELWTPAVVRTGMVAVYVGPLQLHKWTPGAYDFSAIQRTVRAGMMVGAKIPIEVVDSTGRPITPTP